MILHSLAGNTQRLDGGAMFGNAPKALWSRWIEPDANNAIEIACRCLLARDVNGANILFETGIGDFFEPKYKTRYGVSQDGHRLLESLEAIGLSDEDVDLVVLSHLHFDHAGGLLSSWREDAPLSLRFPKAQFLVGAEHWQRAINPHPRDRASFIPELNQLLETSGRLHRVTGERHPLTGDAVRYSFSHGHTPGMMHSQIADLVYCADLIPGRHWVHVPISMGYDRCPEQLINEKQAFLAQHLGANHRLFFTHDPEYACARIDHSDGRYGAIDLQTHIEEEY